MSQPRLSNGVIDLSMGEFQDSLFQKVAVLHEGLLSVEGLAYPPHAGSHSLVSLLQEGRTPHDILATPLSGQSLQVTAGAKEALGLALHAMRLEGQSVLIPDIGWPSYPAMVAAAGGQPVLYPVTDPVGFLVKHVSRPSPAAAMLVNYPHNPTGSILTRAEATDLLRITDVTGMQLLSDEVYRVLSSGTTPWLTAAADPDLPTGHLWVADSISKSMSAPGLRLGLLLSPATLANLHEVRTQVAGVCVTTISQVLVTAGLLNGNLSALLEERSVQLAAARELVADRITSSGGVVRGSEGLYIWADCSDLNVVDGCLVEMGSETWRGASGDRFSVHGAGYLRFCAGSARILSRVRQA